MPWLVFHGWLSLLTLMQHTAPHTPFSEAGPDHDRAQAVLNGTVTVKLPRYADTTDRQPSRAALSVHSRSGLCLLDAETPP
jgi:hypothetical protein